MRVAHALFWSRFSETPFRIALASRANELTPAFPLRLNSDDFNFKKGSGTFPSSSSPTFHSMPPPTTPMFPNTWRVGLGIFVFSYCYHHLPAEYHHFLSRSLYLKNINYMQAQTISYWCISPWTIITEKPNKNMCTNVYSRIAVEVSITLLPKFIIFVQLFLQYNF